MNKYNFLFAGKNLPKASEEEYQHTIKMYEYLKTLIKENDNITFATFMEKCLYAPGLGYYSSGKMPFGPVGDFITAPIISNYFGACIARFYLTLTNTIKDAPILEFGSGNGKLALDILNYLKENDKVIPKYFILEPSSALQQIQKEKLQAFAEHITWLQTLPKAFNGLVLANEVLDAFAIERIKITKQDAKQSFVSMDKSGEFKETFLPISSPSMLNYAEYILKELNFEHSNEYITEVNTLLTPWLAALKHKIQQGVVLLIDYGFPMHEYYHPTRTGGTLMCHFKHHAHSNPFILPGTQDITAHINFTQVASAAHKFGFDIAGYTTQAHFLMDTGLIELCESSKVDANTNQQLKTLLLPEEMGELFKVMALSKNIADNLPGFAVDLVNKL